MNKKTGGALLVLVVAILSVIFGQDLLQQFGLDEGEPFARTAPLCRMGLG